MAVRTFRKVDFSGGLQTATTRILRKPNELVGAKNVEYKSYIGGATRRLGYTKVGDTLRSGKDALGAFVHRWSTGSRQYMASNNAGNTNTSLSYLTGSTWTDLVAGLGGANVKVQSINHLGEAYVVGASDAGTYINMRSIDSSPSSSTTRNVYTAPRSKFIAEFQGSLFAINAQVNLPAGFTTLPDRAYKSSAPTGAITFVKGDQSGETTPTSNGTIKVDSVRYIKAGMGIDVYAARTETANYTNIVVSSVDKFTNTINFLPNDFSIASGAVNPGTDVLTVPMTTWLTTGQPVVLTGGVSMPNPLVAGTVYYVISVTSTTIKLATTRANALASTAIDITTTGSGGLFIARIYNFTNRDEIWGTGRKNLLSVYWNTDYPTTETADFLRIPQGKDDTPEFTGWASTTARLFLFTRNSFYKYDGANFVPVSTTIGALSHEAIKVIGQWVIFPHYTGLWGYNDTTGQLQLLSRGVKDWFKAVPDANWSTASAGVIDNVYKLSVGSGLTYNGEAVSGVVRFVYDFDSNNFSTEIHTRNMRYQFLQTYNSQIKLHFADDTGNLYVDEVGNTDDGATIPFEIELGRDNYTIDEVKNYLSCYVYTESPRGATVKYQIEGGNWKTLGTLTSDVQMLKFSDGIEGRDINLKISQNDDGDPISVIMIVNNFNTQAQAYDI